MKGMIGRNKESHTREGSIRNKSARDIMVMANEGNKTLMPKWTCKGCWKVASLEKILTTRMVESKQMCSRIETINMKHIKEKTFHSTAVTITSNKPHETHTIKTNSKKNNKDRPQFYLKSPSCPTNQTNTKVCTSETNPINSTNTPQ